MENEHAGAAPVRQHTDTLFWAAPGTVAVLLHADLVRPWFAGVAAMFALMWLRTS